MWLYFSDWPKKQFALYSNTNGHPVNIFHWNVKPCKIHISWSSDIIDIIIIIIDIIGRKIA